MILIDEVLFGIAGMVLAAALLFYTVRIQENFGRHTDINIALFFPRQKAQVALEVMIGAFTIIAIGMVVGSAGVLYADPLLDTASRILVGTGLLGLVWFVRTMADLTSEA